MGKDSQLSITTAPLNLLLGGSYADLHGTLKTMKQLREESIVQGFELQDLAEWDSRGPPRDIRMKAHRLKVWEKCEKFSSDEKISMTSEASILSIHANRDVGIYLCSEDDQEQLHGRTLIKETLEFAEAISAHQAVFHLWDTWSPDFDLKHLRNELYRIASHYPSVIPSVENVPTHLEDFTPYDLVREFDWITLDTRWAGMYNELDAFSEITNKISNVHLRGSLEGDEWQLHKSPYSFQDALDKIVVDWGYSGLVTVEPERSEVVPTWDGIRLAMNLLWEQLTPE